MYLMFRFKYVQFGSKNTCPAKEKADRTPSPRHSSTSLNLKALVRPLCERTPSFRRSPKMSRYPYMAQSALFLSNTAPEKKYSKSGVKQRKRKIKETHENRKTRTRHPMR